MVCEFLCFFCGNHWIGYAGYPEGWVCKCGGKAHAFPCEVDDDDVIVVRGDDH